MPIPALLAGPFALVLLLGFLAPAYAFVHRVLGASRTSVRWTASGMLTLWLLSAAFHALASGGWFRLPIALALAVSSAGASWLVLRRTHDVRGLLRADWAALRSFVGQGTPATRILLVGLALLAVVSGLRGIAVPPMAWDDLTYHLFKAGTWVQAGRVVREAAPDAWSYYDYLPGGGEVLWAWAMLPAHGDTFVCLAPVAIWGLCVLAGYAAARQLDFDPEWSLAASAAICSLPAVARFMESNYVDNVGLAGVLGGAALLFESKRNFRFGAAFLCAASFALLPAVKANGLPFFALGIVALLFAAPRGAAPRGRGAGTLLGVLGVSLVAFAIALPWYARAWIERGSPFYPLATSLFGWRLPGNEEFDAIHRGVHDDPPLPLVDLLFRLAWMPLNFKPLPYFYVVLAIPGAVLLWRRQPRLAVLFLTGVVLVTCGLFASDLSRELRGRWVAVLARLLLPGMAAVVLLAAGAAKGRLRAAWYALVAMQVGFSLPFDGWGPSDAQAIGEWLLWPLVLALVAGLAALLLRRRRVFLRYAPLALGAFALFAGFLLAFATDSTRVDHRYSSYDELRNDRTSRLHGMDDVICDFPFWRVLDRTPGSVIAFTGGFLSAKAGQTWGRYPLLGSGLQNQVVYVPITSDGSIVDYWRPAEALAAFDQHAWLQRLRDRAVDYLVVLQPDPPEASVVAGARPVFELLGQNPCATGRLYRVHREQIRP